MTSIAAKPVGNPVGLEWLRGRSFDLAFIVGVAALALTSGAVAALYPSLFSLLLLADLWLLGYQHVISTFTRITFDRESFAKYSYLVTWVPLVVIAGTVAMAKWIGFWSVASLYLYWQWFHYSRQSYGIAQAYRRKANGLVTEDGLTFQLVFYLVPLWGILHRSSQNPRHFLLMNIKTVPVPPVVANAVGAVALAALAWWIGRKAVAFWRGRLPVAHTLFMLSHFTVFIVGYVVLDDIDHGWLVLNVWHNAQYLMFVWLYNNSRFGDKVSERSPLLSTLSRTRNVALYFGLCLALSTLVYLLLENVVAAVATGSLAYIVLAYQIINFHHYIVDAVVWRGRRKAGAPQPAAH